MAMKPASVEQQAVIAVVRAGRNVSIQAVAGAGKTTTILHLARTCPELRILMLTYNTRLKIETREKVAALSLTNVTATNYHAFGYSYLGPDCKTDEGLVRYIRAPTNLKGIIPEFDVICIDEIQDMTPLLYEFSMHIVAACPAAQLVVFGDCHQCVYRFRGADPRYLTERAGAWPGDRRLWAGMRLSTSYRLSRQTADFVEKVMMPPGFIIRGCHDGPRPEYHILNIWNTARITRIITQFLVPPFGRGKYQPDQIFILANSLASGKLTPLAKLENELSGKGIPIWSNTNVDCGVTEELLRGKLCISTFHTSKGLERPVVVIMGFDAGYYVAGNNKNIDRKSCPNSLYVGATRAIDQLVLIHNSTSEYLPFIDPETVGKWATVHGEERSIRASLLPVTEVELRKALTFLAEEQVIDAISGIEFETVRPAGTCTRVAESAAQLFGDKKLSEDVSDINCMAVTSYVESRRTGQPPSVWTPESVANPTIPNGKPCAEIVEQYLRISASYDARESGYRARVNQISEWNWITPSSFGKLVNRLETSLGTVAQMKWATRHFRPVKVGKNTIKVYCTISAKSEQDAFDVRCFARISPAHRLRLICIAAIHQGILTADLPTGRDPPVDPDYRIVNIRTGEEIRLLTRDPDRLGEILSRVINLRFETRPEITDEQFREKALANWANAVGVHTGEADEGDEGAGLDDQFNSPGETSGDDEPGDFEL